MFCGLLRLGSLGGTDAILVLSLKYIYSRRAYASLARRHSKADAVPSRRALEREEAASHLDGAPAPEAGGAAGPGHCPHSRHTCHNFLHSAVDLSFDSCERAVRVDNTRRPPAACGCLWLLVLADELRSSASTNSGKKLTRQ